MWKWVDLNDKVKLLVEDADMRVYGFVFSDGFSFKARMIRDKIYFKNEPGDYDRIMAARRDAVGDRMPNSWEEGMRMLENVFGLINVPKQDAQKPADVMQILAKIKDLTLYGKLEIVLKIEYVNPPVPEKKEEPKPEAPQAEVKA